MTENMKNNMRMIPDELLEMIQGGKLSEDASAWVNRNYSTLMARADAIGMKSTAQWALSYVKGMKDEVSLSELKSFLSSYINVSDLN